MARLQILQLPEGAGDERPPFILVIDQVPSDEAKFDAIRRDLLADGDLAPRLGARAVLVFEETIEIPANVAAASPWGREVPCPLCEEETVWLSLSTAEEHFNEVHGQQGREDELAQQLAEARQWARHGYEIGQKHCGWTDHGVAPAWLTSDWPTSFGICDHLKRAVQYDEALTRVRNLPERPEVMAANPEQPYATWDGYAQGIRAAKQAASVEPPQATEDGG
jgi:hypothetical protein